MTTLNLYKALKTKELIVPQRLEIKYMLKLILVNYNFVLIKTFQ